MVRCLAVAAVLSCFAASAWAQVQPAPAVQAAPAKSDVKKPASKTKAVAKPAVPVSVGPCKYGIITATEDIFTVQKIGLTVFNNEYAEVPVSWGFDDLIYARTRAAAGAISVQRITYAKGTFASYYHPKSNLFRNARQELTDLVRQIAGNAGCERYLVVTRLDAQLQGTNQTLNGIGILNRGVGFINHSWLFAYVSVIVFDGQTFEIRKDPNANFEAVLARMAANLTKNESLRDIDNSAFPVSPVEAANSAILRDSARAFLTERLDKFLPAYFKD
jgi:hypothetical protein